jgi:hypothetical protein
MTTDPGQADPQTHPATPEEEVPEIVPGETEAPTSSFPSGPQVIETDT